MFSQPENNIEQFHIDPGMIVADLGSGAGFYSFALSEAVGESGKVYAVDVQKDLLSKLRNEAMSRNLTNIEIVWGDLDEVNGTTLKDNSVDRVVVANVLFQLEDTENFVKESRRILRPNGKILVVDWTDSHAGLGPAPDAVIKPDVARTLFEDAGFVFDRDIEAGEHHYGMVFKYS
jgi:ubiquinone/menaquinone biosynthesis C-methylase UbiE